MQYSLSGTDHPVNPDQLITKDATTRSTRKLNDAYRALGRSILQGSLTLVQVQHIFTHKKCYLNRGKSMGSRKESGAY